jgi:hypothetical protein
MEISGQLHAPAALPPGKESLVPIVVAAFTTAILHETHTKLYHMSQERCHTKY